MKKLLFYIFTFFYIFSYSQETKCPLSNLANDLVGANDQFKSILNTNEGFDAYKILNIDAPNLRTNIDELKNVSNHLDEIKNAEGYLKWKNLNNTVDEALLATVKEKLEVIKLWIDPSVLKTKLPKIITSLEGAGNDGISILNKIKSGDFDNIDGYKDLIKKLTDPNQVKPVKQAINKADEYPNLTNDLKKFEFEDQANSIDVDFGTLTTSGGPPYSFSEAFQFKFANTVNAVKNRITETALSKINNATAESKIFQINMGTGSVSDVLKISNWENFIKGKKAKFPDLEIRIFDGAGGSLIY
ncbi:hypothetical protein [Tenacibaculum halocynthiae]|uniref:hypothetical protein n=1 Tax=Tenacibaculum halocynthiae TaxID=1254437 RepID=UPI003D64BE12